MPAGGDIRIGKIPVAVVSNCEILWRAEQRGWDFSSESADATSLDTKAATNFLFLKYLDVLTNNGNGISNFELKSLKGQCTVYSKHHKPGDDDYDARYSNALMLANTRISSNNK